MEYWLSGLSRQNKNKYIIIINAHTLHESSHTILNVKSLNSMDDRHSMFNCGRSRTLNSRDVDSKNTVNAESERNLTQKYVCLLYTSRCV